MTDIRKENPRAGRAGMVPRHDGASEAERERKIPAGDFDSVFSCEYLSAGKPRLIVIVGPTGAGKTELALALAKKYNGEIIGADSRQVYKKLNIGTAKPKGSWRGGAYRVAGVPYHLVDIIEPDELFTLADYKKLALQKIKEAIGRGRRPMLVGGTGLYVSAVVHNWQLPSVAADKKLRQELEGKSNAELLELLAELDPASYQTIDKKNQRRILRAVEVCLKSGQPFSLQRQKGQPLFDFLQIGLAPPRPELYDRIDKRVEDMMGEGLVAEVKSLLAAGYSKDLPALSGIGYAEIVRFLQGEINLAEAVRLLKLNSRHYARRQLTWFTRQNPPKADLGGLKKDQTIRWVKDSSEADSLVANFI